MDWQHALKWTGTCNHGRRQVLRGGGRLAMAAVGLVAGAPAVLASIEPAADVSALTHMNPIEKPLLVFRDYQGEQDAEVRSYIQTDLEQRPDILGLIRERTGYQDELRLDIEDLAVQLLYVPELRPRYAGVYERYCRAATVQVCRRLDRPAVIAEVITPRTAVPDLPNRQPVAYVVHQLGKRYRADCRFTADTGRSVKLRLSGAFLSSHQGGVDLDIRGLKSGKFTIRRRPYSIWQNRSSHLYTLLAIPVEETLHYLAGASTDRRLAVELGRRDDWTVAQVRQLAGQWMAIEEALVGGMVHQMLPALVRHEGIDLSPSALAWGDRLADQAGQYIFRRAGLRLVKSMGAQQALSFYGRDPDRFKSQLTDITGTGA